MKKLILVLSIFGFITILAVVKSYANNKTKNAIEEKHKACIDWNS